MTAGVPQQTDTGYSIYVTAIATARMPYMRELASKREQLIEKSEINIVDRLKNARLAKRLFSHSTYTGGGKLHDLGIRHCYLSKSNIQKQQVSGFYTNFACVYFVSNNNRLLGSRAR